MLDNYFYITELQLDSNTPVLAILTSDGSPKPIVGVILGDQHNGKR